MLSAVRISGSRDAPFPKVSLSWAPPPVIPPVANLDTGEDRAEQIGGGMAADAPGASTAPTDP